MRITFRRSLLFACQLTTSSLDVDAPPQPDRAGDSSFGQDLFEFFRPFMCRRPTSVPVSRVQGDDIDMAEQAFELSD